MLAPTFPGSSRLAASQLTAEALAAMEDLQIPSAEISKRLLHEHGVDRLRDGLTHIVESAA